MYKKLPIFTIKLPARRHFEVLYNYMTLFAIVNKRPFLMEQLDLLSFRK